MADITDNKRKNYFFEAGPASGVLVYIIDEDEPVCLKFSSAIKIKVLFDSSDKWHDAPNLKEDTADSLSVKDHPGHSQDFAGGSQAVESNVDVPEDPMESHSYSLKDTEAKHQEGDLSSEPRRERTQKKKARKLSDNKKSEPAKRGRQGSLDLSPKFVSHTKEDAAEDGLEDREDDLTVKDRTTCNENVPKADDEIPSRKLRRSDRKCVKLKLEKRVKALGTKSVVTQSKKTRKEKVAVPSQRHKMELEKKELERESDVNSQVRTRKLLMEKTVKCEYCEVNFKNQQEFYDHRRAAESKHVCGICGKSEPYEAHLIVHMQKHRRVKLESSVDGFEVDAEMVEEKVNEKTSSGKKKKYKEKMKCNLCDLVVSSMDSLKIHTMLHTGEYSYRCCMCGENFSSLSSRQHHMDTHVSTDRFKCIPCEQRFASRADLAKHQLTHEIKCALCGEIFPNKTSRTCHYRVAHPDDILKCPLCTNMFASEEDLSKHLVYHKKGKKEQCPECGVVVSKLKDHMLLHTEAGQEKMFVCDQCPMRYLRKSNLDRHMRTHTGEKPYACNRCTKCFRSNGMLRKHLLTHTQERPFQCEVCGKRCSLRSNLNIHMRVHNSDRQFQCSYCPQAFNHKNSLHGHMRNKHSREMTLQEAVTLGAHPSPPLPPPPSLPPPQDMLPDMDKTLPLDPNSHHLQMGIQAGMGASLDPELMKSEMHQDYNQMHMQMVYPTGITANMHSNILLDADRMAMNKYDLQPQDNHTHSY